MKNAVIKSLYESMSVLRESYEYWTEEDWARKLKKVCHLNKEEADDLLHDLNNLRGNEWLEIVEDNCDDEELLIAFKEFIGANDIWEDEFDESLNEANLDKKLFKEYKILVDGRVFEISHTPQRRDEIIEILKKDFPNSKIEVQPYNHYESGYSRKQLERIIDKQLQEYGVNESLKEDYNSDLEIERKVQKYLDDHNLWGEVSVQDGTVYVEIHWGDWKHDHWYCQDLMSDLGYVLIGKEVTEEDGSDTFSAIHTYEKLDVNEE